VFTSTTNRGTLHTSSALPTPEAILQWVPLAPDLFVAPAGRTAAPTCINAPFFPHLQSQPNNETETRPRASSSSRICLVRRLRHRLGPERAQCDCASHPIVVSSLSRSQAPLSATRSCRRRRHRPRPPAQPTSSPRSVQLRVCLGLSQNLLPPLPGTSPEPPLAITMTRENGESTAHPSLQKGASRLRAPGFRHNRRAVPDTFQGRAAWTPRSGGCVSKKSSPLAQTNIVPGHCAHVSRSPHPRPSLRRRDAQRAAPVRCAAQGGNGVRRNEICGECACPNISSPRFARRPRVAAVSAAIARAPPPSTTFPCPSLTRTRSLHAPTACSYARAHQLSHLLPLRENGVASPDFRPAFHRTGI
jgi:hypothetical protein